MRTASSDASSALRPFAKRSPQSPQTGAIRDSSRPYEEKAASFAEIRAVPAVWPPRNAPDLLLQPPLRRPLPGADEALQRIGGPVAGAVVPGPERPHRGQIDDRPAADAEADRGRGVEAAGRGQPVERPRLEEAPHRSDGGLARGLVAGGQQFDEGGVALRGPPGLPVVVRIGDVSEGVIGPVRQQQRADRRRARHRGHGVADAAALRAVVGVGGVRHRALQSAFGVEVDPVAHGALGVERRRQVETLRVVAEQLQQHQAASLPGARNAQHPAVERRVEEPGLPASAAGEVHRMQHQAERLGEGDRPLRAVRLAEVGGELAAAEVGPREALSARDATPELVAVLRSVFPAGRDVGLRADDVVDVPQRQRVALHALVGGVGAADPAGARPAARALLGLALADLVAPDRDAADRREHEDLLDAPAELRLPEDRFEHAARGGRRHHRVADALHLHLGPREARQRPADPDFDGVHRIAPPVLRLSPRDAGRAAFPFLRCRRITGDFSSR